MPVHVAFLGCGFITAVHSRHLRALRDVFVPSYASRDGAKAERWRRRYRGHRSYQGYDAALADPDVDAVVVAVPPRWHLPLTLQALAAGKHVLVEKPAFLATAEYEQACAARDRAGRVVLVGENDHYKPLARCLRRLIGEGVIGDLVFARFVTLAKRFKSADDWRNEPALAGGDAFFEEGVHWLHLANSLGPSIVAADGYRPANAASDDGSDTRPKSLLVAFRYDTAAVGALFYSREVPVLLHGISFSTLFGRDGIITFESNGGFVVVRGRGWPRVVLPGWRDIRGYGAMYRDFAAAIQTGRIPEMSLEAALVDQRVMDRIMASAVAEGARQ